MGQQRKFGQEFKREAVELTRLRGRRQPNGRRPGCSSNLLIQWRWKPYVHGKKSFVYTGMVRDQKTTARDRQMARLTKASRSGSVPRMGPLDS